MTATKVKLVCQCIAMVCSNQVKQLCRSLFWRKECCSQTLRTETVCCLQGRSFCCCLQGRFYSFEQGLWWMRMTAYAECKSRSWEMVNTWKQNSSELFGNLSSAWPCSWWWWSEDCRIRRRLIEWEVSADLLLFLKSKLILNNRLIVYNIVYNSVFFPAMWTRASWRKTQKRQVSIFIKTKCNLIWNFMLGKDLPL